MSSSNYPPGVTGAEPEITAPDEPDEDDAPDIWDQSRMATDLICTQARMLRALPLDRLIDAYSKAESIGPIMDPTGYREHGGGIRTAMKVVRAARRFVFEIEEAIKEAKGET